MKRLKQVCRSLLRRCGLALQSDVDAILLEREAERRRLCDENCEAIQELMRRYSKELELCESQVGKLLKECSFVQVSHDRHDRYKIELTIDPRSIGYGRFEPDLRAILGREFGRMVEREIRTCKFVTPVERW